MFANGGGPDEWANIVALVRAYALRKYGSCPDGITIHLPSSRKEHFESFPASPIYHTPFAAAPMQLGRDPRLPKWVKDESQPAHLSDFQMVYWPGLGVFTLSPKQSLVVKKLWAAWEEGLPGVKRQLLLEAADSDGTRLVDLFRRSDAWGKLIVVGPIPGTVTLPHLDPIVDPDELRQLEDE